MTIQTRWRKVFLDLSANKSRTLLVVMAITVGVFAVGFVSNAQWILLRELDRGYQATEASSAQLFTTPVDADTVAGLVRLPEVGAVAGRRTLNVNVRVTDIDTRNMVVSGVSDFGNMPVDRVLPVEGEWPPVRDGLIIEHLSVDYLGAGLNDLVTLEFEDGSQRELPVVAVVHDPNLPSSRVGNVGFAFASMDTISEMGLGDYFTEVRFRVADNVLDADHIDAVATAVSDKLEKGGATVFATEIPIPGEHWAQNIIETLVLLFTVFGFLILGLSGFLVVNTITALIAQQIKQIGVMKLVGARRRQILGMYLVMVLSYGLLSLLLGVPTSILMAQWVIGFAAELLNVRILSYAISPMVVVVQVAVGLLVPVLAAFWPVLNGARITTFEALNNQGISSGSASQRFTDSVMSLIQRLLPVQRPLIISLRNTVRKKARLALTLATLIMGTALFIAVLTVRDSVQVTINDFLRYDQYDVGVNLTRPYRLSQLETAAAGVPNISTTEGWLTANVRRIYADDSTSEGIRLTAVPPETRFMDPQMEDGRWLTSADENAIVVNTDFRDDHPDLAIGDEVPLQINGREMPMQIVGVVLGSASGAAVFANYDTYAFNSRQPGMVSTFKIKTNSTDVALHEETAAAIITTFDRAGISVDNTRTIAVLRANIEYLFNIVVWFLVLMAILLAVVGGLGLTTTMSINVLERIREIGVLRAIGASDSAVRQIVLAEGMIIGVISWSVGSVLALPVSRVLSDQVGLAMLGFPLNYTFAVGGTFMWLVLLIGLAAAASLGPARNASRLTIREVLAYE